MSLVADELSLSKEMFLTIDEMIPYVGEFKKFQWMVAAMFCVLMLPVGSQVMIMYFAALNPTWKCAENSTLCAYNGTHSPDNGQRCVLPRTEWEYTQPKEYSIVTYFDIHCDKSWLIDLSTSMVFVGSLCGSLLVGWAAGTYGRTKIIYISTALIILAAILASFMTNVYLFISCRFVTGFFLTGVFQSSVFLSEIVASRYRPLASTIIWCFFPFSLCVMGLMAYFIRSWKSLFLACSAPYVFVVLFYFFTPESPRWLRLNGKMEELTQTFAKIAKFNKKVIPSNLTILPTPSVKQIRNPLYLFRRCDIALITIITGYASFVNAMVFYGISLIAGQFGGSLYLNFVLISLSEIPAGFCCIILSNRFGRKKTTTTAVFSAGIACVILSILVHMKLTTASIVFGMVGKFFVTLSWNGLVIWSVELFPTSLRSQAYSFFSVLITIGSASAPWMISALHSLHVTGPYICMSVATLFCCFSLLFMKETKGLPTLECEADMQNENSTCEEGPFL